MHIIHQAEGTNPVNMNQKRKHFWLWIAKWTNAQKFTSDKHRDVQFPVTAFRQHTARVLGKQEIERGSFHSKQRASNNYFLLLPIPLFSTPYYSFKLLFPTFTLLPSSSPYSFSLHQIVISYFYPTPIPLIPISTYLFGMSSSLHLFIVISDTLLFRLLFNLHFK